MKNYRLVCAVAVIAMAPYSIAFADIYLQTDLVSDVPGMAATTDPNLKNPWGMSFSATSPFWISNEATNTATLYNGAGVPNSSVVVTVPGGPTGQVQNSAGAGNFLVGSSAASFIFDTLSGTISAWNSSLGTMGTASTMVPTSGAVYTGLALGNNGTANYLYAANFSSGGGIDVFDSNWHQVNSTTFAGKFVDPSIPAGYVPFNIQLIGNNLYVEYAEVGSTPGNAMRGLGLGFVDEYDLNGNLEATLISKGQLDAPWGVTLAPATFGQFSGDLLVGNFGNGEINAFDPNSGTYLGTLDGPGGTPIVVNNLWALDFRTNGGDGSDPDALYFDAGINGQKDGLFGELTLAPEPSAFWLLATLGGFVVLSRRLAHR